MFPYDHEACISKMTIAKSSSFMSGNTNKAWLSNQRKPDAFKEQANTC